MWLLQMGELVKLKLIKVYFENFISSEFSLKLNMIFNPVPPRSLKHPHSWSLMELSGKYLAID